VVEVLVAVADMMMGGKASVPLLTKGNVHVFLGGSFPYKALAVMFFSLQSSLSVIMKDTFLLSGPYSAEAVTVFQVEV